MVAGERVVAVTEEGEAVGEVVTEGNGQTNQPARLP